MSEEQKVPTKEEILAFLGEQIEVKSKQLELQEISTKLAVNRAEELKALNFIGQMTNPVAPEPHILTEEDLEQHPELTEAGYKAGDEVMVAKEEPKQRSLKKEKK
jgi:hypothetical protein